MSFKNYLYIDIETTGKHKDLNDLKENDKRGYELFLRKVKRKSDNLTDWKTDINDVYKTKSPIIPEFGKIVCISFAYYKKDELMLSSLYGDDESKIIKGIHRLLYNVSEKTTYGLCGFYIKGFDIPWINRKMLKYDLHIPRLLRTHNVKPWEMNILDLSDVWRSTGTLEHVSFDEMLYELGIKSPKSDISGSDVHRVYWEDHDIERIKKYCENDVKSVIEATKKIINNI